MSIESIVANQRAYFSSDATKPIAFRLDALKRLKRTLQQNEHKLCRALRADLNKDEMEAYMTEIGIVLEELSFHIKHIRRWARPKTVPTPLAQFHGKSFILPEPYGVKDNCSLELSCSIMPDTSDWSYFCRKLCDNQAFRICPCCQPCHSRTY